ncbi:hypothetical protein P4H83_09210 [Paenibacillus favisporus]|uniref:hypothetical protein n=1 Tax=Paenibacillus TaxID=44249 RepID=UPI0011AB4D87|nr:MULTISPECIES: hypothetical protein [Paenibacillus]MEC0175052.1 hypothetical protein [Paenibacillus favisporus]
MIDELLLAAAYGQRVIVGLKNGEVILGRAQISTLSGVSKIKTDNNIVWVPHEDIEYVERLKDW